MAGNRTAATPIRNVQLVRSTAWLLVFWIVHRRRPAFELLRDHLHACGIDVGPSMTMEEALDELRRSRPEIATTLAPLIALYEEERFSPHGKAARDVIRRRLAELDSVRA